MIHVVFVLCQSTQLEKEKCITYDILKLRMNHGSSPNTPYSQSDMTCGKKAGCSTISIGNNNFEYADNKFCNLNEAINHILTFQG